MKLETLTPAGRVAAGLGPLLVLVGVISGWAEFTLVGLAGVFALLLGAAFVAREQPIGVTRSLYPPKVTVGESAVGVLTVTNTGTRRSGMRTVEDQLGAEVVRIEIPPLARNASIEFPYQVPARHRGVIPVGPLTVARSDPFGLFRLVRTHGEPGELWSRPQTHLLSSVSSGWAKDLDGPTSDRAPKGSAAFHTLREYQFGDDLRHVHWKTTARRGELMVRQFVDTRRSSEVVLVDPRSDVYTSGPQNSSQLDANHTAQRAYEGAIEVAASVCAAAARADRPLTLLLPSCDGPATNRLEVLDRLTLATSNPDISLADVFAGATRACHGATALIVVTGQADAQPIIHRARTALRSGLVVVIRVAPTEAPSLVHVGGARIVTTPDAEQLRSMWDGAVIRA